MKKKRNYLCVACLIALCMLAVSINFTAIAESSDGWSKSTLGTEYVYKETLQVPARTYTRGGTQYPAAHTVCFPDGHAENGESVVLSQAGIYTVKYSVQAGDAVFAANSSFAVSYPAYDVGNEKSALQWGTPNRATNEGVMVDLAVNDSLTFTEYIDFEGVTQDDPLVTGYVTPSVAGASEFTELVFTFADSVDPTVYFQVHYYGYDWCENTYVAANGNNQVPTGKHATQGIHVNDGYGMWSCVTFQSKRKTGPNNDLTTVAPDDPQFSVAMNYAEKALYGLQYYGASDVMYCDLDDPEYFAEAWNGFPSGKARLTVSLNGYTGSSASFCITGVHGLDADDLKNNLYSDNDAPTISVDKTYADEMPIALMGYDYPVPQATAYDAYAYECDVRVSVWYNYGASNSVNVPVTDGKFHVDRLGTYGIVYDATDAMGNAAQQVRYVIAYEEDEIEEVTFEIPTEKTTSAAIGAWVQVPAVDASAITGGSGKNKTIAVYTEIGGVREKITDGFRALQLGTYKVVYVVTDYVGKNTEKSYDVTVNDGGADRVPILETDYDVYPAYISGSAYALPEYYAYYYENGVLQRNLCEVEITDGSGTHTYTAGDKATVTIKDNGDVITFAVKSKGVTLATHTATGVLAWVQEDTATRLHIENYLVGEEFTVNKTSGGMVIADTGRGEFAFTFANALGREKLTMQLANFVNAQNGAQVRIVLHDPLRKNIAAQAVLGNDGGRTYLEADDGTRIWLSTALDGAASISLNFENDMLIVGSQALALDFDGFSGEKAFLRIECEGFGANGGFTFVQLANSPFGTATTDRVRPVLLSRVETGGTFSPDATYVLQAPIAYDVYAPNIDYKLTVTDPSGNPVTDESGVLLQNADPYGEYTIRLRDIGRYFVSYTATEDPAFLSRGNTETLSFTLTVADEIKPTITVQSNIVTQAYVGDTIVVPNFTVSDNNTAADDLIVRLYAETPIGQLFMLPGNSIIAHHAGEYKLYIMVADEAGNLASASFTVTVTERG